ncbi:MAG TPA: AMP-binding protein [Candidatus Dormibacteraeota bacterium]|nr:AMP-binding protein [Candidatus Dormibacteraeota bacterium]
MLVRDFLEHSAEKRPDKVALIVGCRRFTYAEINAQANCLAQALAAHGISRGDRVVVHLPNCLAAVIGIFGALKAGAVFVPVNASAKPEKLAYILNNCRASALLTDLPPALVPKTPSLKLQILCKTVQHARVIGRPANSAEAASIDFDGLPSEWLSEPLPTLNQEDDLACLIYTSGSTGQAKGVMCEHRNVVFASGSIIQYLENSESDIVLGLLPLSFDYGLYQLLMTLRFGGTLILEQSFAFPALILQRIAQERVTGLPGVPTIFTLLLGLDIEDYDLSSLRYLTNTAAALPPSQVLELQTRFPKARLYSMYGLTETKRTLYLPPAELNRRPGSVGIPIPGTEAWVEDDEGRRLRPGTIGELVVRGPHVMRGYWEAPEETARRFRPGPTPGEKLCYSGDLFRQDADGFFYFVGRKDDIIKSRGEKVAPKEVEEVLCSLPGIVEAAVLGTPDPILGQAITAFVVRRDLRLSTTRVIAHCRAHLEDFMVPRHVQFLEGLPKNASGKVDKLALKILQSSEADIGRHAVKNAVSASPQQPVRLELEPIASYEPT